MARMLAALAALTLLLGGPAIGQPAPTAAAGNDYGNQANWLCWPGRSGDACAIDLTTTVVQADGTTSLERAQIDADAPIDCFYVYPTVSRDPGALSDMIPGPEERSTVAAQLARFGVKCRLFAPMYRQFTLTALTAMMSGRPMPEGGGPAGFQTGYNDVRDAWTWYLAHENHGRGVVLIGHSQGSLLLTGLISQEIDGHDSQRLLVSALLIGSPVGVTTGGETGTFQHIPPCRRPDQSGCFISYSSFRDTATPAPGTRFARVYVPGQSAACTNPADLAGGGPATARSYLSMAGLAGRPPASTRFVAAPGLITARCVNDGTFNYLSIHVNADPADARADDIRGDIPGAAGPDRSWGLHLVDMGLFMGDLVDVVGRQSAAWRASHH